eukprot:364444-Chlamydomonas_euryale.AAC.19
MQARQPVRRHVLAQLARHFASEAALGRPAHAIYSSDLARAMDTSGAIARALDTQVGKPMRILKPLKCVWGGGGRTLGQPGRMTSSEDAPCVSLACVDIRGRQVGVDIRGRQVGVDIRGRQVGCRVFRGHTSTRAWLVLMPFGS